MDILVCSTLVASNIAPSQSKEVDLERLEDPVTRSIAKRPLFRHPRLQYGWCLNVSPSRSRIINHIQVVRTSDRLHCESSLYRFEFTALPFCSQITDLSKYTASHLEFQCLVLIISLLGLNAGRSVKLKHLRYIGRCYQ